MGFIGTDGHQNQYGSVIAAAVDQPTFYYSVKFKVQMNSSQQQELESGINVEIFRFLCDALNFTGKAVKTRGQMTENEKGEVMNKGIVAALNSGLADIAISLYEPLPYRMAGPFGIRFLHAVFKSSKAVAVFTQPAATSASNVYGRPFQTNVWHSIFGLALLIIVSTITWLPIKLKYSYRVNIDLYQICNYTKIFTMCIFTRQGCFEDINAIQPTPFYRLPLIIWFISSLIFHSIFSSTLTSIFAVDIPPISSFLKLVGKRYTMYYDKYVPSIENILENRTTVIEMGNSIQSIMKKAAPEIFKSKAALLTTDDRYYPYFKNYYHDAFLCSKLATVSLPSGPVKSTNFVRQGSPLRNVFNAKLLLMQQSGLIERLYREHDIKTQLRCLKSADSEIVNLDLYDTAFPFTLLFYFVFLSIVILVSEIIIRKLKRDSLKYIYKNYIP